MKIFTLLLAISMAMHSCNTSNKQQQAKAQAIQQDSIRKEAIKLDSIKKVEMNTRQAFQYHFEKKSVWKNKDSFEGNKHKELLAALNRVDAAHLKGLDSFIVPDKYIDSLDAYLPFPKYAAILEPINKILIFSYPTQTFAAYEKGKLILTGPTNMGKKSTKTPTGLFFCNWKSKETRSTVNNSWILKWNFNVSNLGGVGFHQYALPGYPASHSCLRLWNDQALYLYNWADQWKLQNNQLVAKGTPVIIYGEYPFGAPRPWYALTQNPKALDISPQDLEAIVTPHLQAIQQAQDERARILEAQTLEASPQNTDTIKALPNA